LIVTDGSKLVENVVDYCSQNMLDSEYFVLGMVNTKAVGATLNTKFLTSVLENMAKKAVDKTVAHMEELGFRNISKHIAVGAPRVETQRYIENNGIDLMIIGLESQLGARNFAFGRLKERILRSTKCPILIINSYLDTTKGIKKILNPTDGKTHSDEAELMALKVAQEYDAQLCKFFIGKDKELGRKVIQRARGRAITSNVEEISILDITDESIPRRILRVAPDYDLIILGKGKKRLLGGDDLALMIKEIIALSPTPVLMVGTPEKKTFWGG
jgi:nucleotide-binding universal stress UspA family protein